MVLSSISSTSETLIKLLTSGKFIKRIKRDKAKNWYMRLAHENYICNQVSMSSLFGCYFQKLHHDSPSFLRDCIYSFIAMKVSKIQNMALSRKTFVQNKIEIIQLYNSANWKGVYVILEQ